MSVADLLQNEIERLGVTQREFAELIGTSVKHVNSMVRGRALPSMEMCRRLERATGVPAEHWWTRVGEDKWD